MPPRIRETDPPAVLYRIGRAPDPLAWPPPRSAAGDNRFDDPLNEFRVLYAAEQRLACFVETLAGFRPSLEWVAAARRIRPGDINNGPLAGRLPDDWSARRRIGAFGLELHQRWLDLRSLETRAALRRAFAPTLVAHDLADFDLSDALSRNRPLTQAIARWAYDRDFNGVVYQSRFDCSFDCWAIFDRARHFPIGIDQIHADDLDLIETARVFDLTL